MSENKEKLNLEAITELLGEMRLFSQALNELYRRTSRTLGALPSDVKMYNAPLDFKEFPSEGLRYFEVIEFIRKQIGCGETLAKKKITWHIANHYLQKRGGNKNDKVTYHVLQNPAEEYQVASTLPGPPFDLVQKMTFQQAGAAVMEHYALNENQTRMLLHFWFVTGVMVSQRRDKTTYYSIKTDEQVLK
jgi:hypothetical protein